MHKIQQNDKIFLVGKGDNIMARLIRPSWAIRCVQSGCKTLFEVAKLEDGKQQEVVCPNCGEHYVYPIYDEDKND